MSTQQLTQDEADRLLEMLKRSLIAELNFPTQEKKEEEFEVIGDTKRDIFVVSIFRGKRNPMKYNFGARIKKSGVLLLELHINPSNKHFNPDGEQIRGNHWHIYREGYGRAWAFPAEDIDSNKFVENTERFFKEFHIIEGPEVYYQETL